MSQMSYVVHGAKRGYVYAHTLSRAFAWIEEFLRTDVRVTLKRIKVEVEMNCDCGRIRGESEPHSPTCASLCAGYPPRNPAVGRIGHSENLRVWPRTAVRPSWDQTWMAVADAVAQRSRCVRRKAGCVVVDRYNRVVATGYNGPPAAMTGCPSPTPCNEWCPRAKSGGSMSYDDCVSVHSEPNALIHGDRSRMDGGTCYVTSCCCLTCAKDIANSGVQRVVLRITEADRERQPELTIELFRRCRINVTIWENTLA